MGQGGIQTSLSYQPVPGLNETSFSHKWQAVVQGGGGFHPALGTGLGFHYVSDAPFTGINDPRLDNLIAEAESSLNPATQAQAYHSVFTYISQMAYSPFLFVVPGFTLTSRSVSGPGLTTGEYQVTWEDVRVT